MVLAMGCGISEGWTDEKYHSLVLVDLVQRRAFQNDGMTEHFRTVVFKTDDELICQNQKGVFKIFIKENNTRHSTIVGDVRGATMFERSTLRTSYNESHEGSVDEENESEIDEIDLDLVC